MGPARNRNRLGSAFNTRATIAKSSPKTLICCLNANRSPHTLTPLVACLALAQDPDIKTPQQAFQRNVGTKEQQMTPVTPFKIIGNLYYTGNQLSVPISSPPPRGSSSSTPITKATCRA